MSLLKTIKRVNFLGAVDTARFVVRGVPGLTGNITTPVAYLRFDVDAGEPSPTYQAQLWWNDDEETLDLRQNGAVLQIGQEQQWHITNNSGAQINDGAVVMATGAIGATGRITGGLMDGTDPDNARFILGVATEDIANNGDGKVSTFGKVRGLDTSGQDGESWSDGDTLFISSTIAGGLSNVEPTAPAISMPIAFVVKANPSVGTLAVRVTPINENIWATFLSADIEAAQSGANAPSASNVFATIVDTQELLSITTAELALPPYNEVGTSWIIRSVTAVAGPPTAPIISLVGTTSTTAVINLGTASVDPIEGTVTTYNVYVDEVLHASDETIAEGGNYSVEGLTTAVEVSITLKGIDDDLNLSPVSNAVLATPGVSVVTPPVISLASVAVNSATITVNTGSTTILQGPVSLYNVYVDTILHASDVTIAEGATYEVTGLTTGVEISITLKGKDAEGTLSVDSNPVLATPAAISYPITVTNGQEIASAYSMTGNIQNSGNMVQTALESFTEDNSSPSTKIAALRNTTAFASTYSWRYKFTSIPVVAGGAFWVPITSGIPTLADAATSLALKKLRFGVVQDGGAEHQDLFASYTDPGGTEYFLQANGTWSTSFVLHETVGLPQIQVQKTGTSYVMTILNADDSVFVTGVITISSVKNGSGSDYISFGTLSNDVASKFNLDVEAGISIVSPPVISFTSKTATSVTITVDTASFDPEEGEIDNYNVYVGGGLHASGVTISEAASYEVVGLTTGVEVSITLRGEDTEANESVDSNAVVQTPSGVSYPNNVTDTEVVASTYSMTADVQNSGTITQTALEDFTMDGQTPITKIAALRNTSAFVGAYTRKYALTDIPIVTGGAFWIPVLSGIPTLADNATSLALKKLRFGISQDGGANQGKMYASYVNTGGTEMFLQVGGTWAAGLVFHAAIGTLQCQEQKTATDYIMSILNGDDSPVVVGTIAISSVKNGTSSDYISFGDLANDTPAKFDIEVLI